MTEEEKKVASLNGRTLAQLGGGGGLVGVILLVTTMQVNGLKETVRTSGETTNERLADINNELVTLRIGSEVMKGADVRQDAEIEMLRQAIENHENEPMHAEIATWRAQVDLRLKSLEGGG